MVSELCAWGRETQQLYIYRCIFISFNVHTYMYICIGIYRTIYIHTYICMCIHMISVASSVVLYKARAPVLLLVGVRSTLLYSAPVLFRALFEHDEIPPRYAIPSS